MNNSIVLAEIHSLLLANSSLLIEKKIFSKEELEQKRSVIFSLVNEYKNIISTAKENDEDEKKKLDRLLEISKNLVKECNLSDSVDSEDFVKMQFEARKS